MFWRFGFHTQSTLDVLLEKEGVTLQEVLDDEDLLQELKTPNRKLLEFVTTPENLKAMFDMIAHEPDEELPMDKKYRYAMLACEVLSSDVAALNDAIISNEALLQDFLKFMDAPAPLDPIRASYFARIFTLLLQKKTGETLAFLMAQPQFLDALVRHAGSSAMVDIVVRLVGCAETDSGTAALEWVLRENLIEKLAALYDADQHPDIHGNVTQCFSEILMMITTMEPLWQYRDALLDRFRSKELVSSVLKGALKQGGANVISATYNALTFLIELIQKYTKPTSLASLGGGGGGGEFGGAPPPPSASRQPPPLYLADLAELVEVALPYIPDLLEILNADYQPPGELAHTSFGQSRPLGSRKLKVVEFLATLVQTEHKAVCDAFIKQGVPRRFLDLMFQYPLHNFLHYQIYEVIDKAINGEPAVYLDLLVSFLVEAKLSERIVEAVKQNDAEQANNSARRGYMGYLTLMTTDLLRLAERDVALPEEAKALLQHESWLEYVNSTYKATQERESKPLGGQKPSAMDSSSFDNPSMYGSSESDNSMSDQMARYLAMQMTGGLPSQALIHDDDDDDLLELDGDRLGNFRASGVYSSTYDDMDSDDEVGDGRMGEREYEYEPPSNFAGVGTNFANFDDIDFAAALAEYGEDKEPADSSEDEEEDEDDDVADRLLSTVTRNMHADDAFEAPAPSAAEPAAKGGDDSAVNGLEADVSSAMHEDVASPQSAPMTEVEATTPVSAEAPGPSTPAAAAAEPEASHEAPAAAASGPAPDAEAATAATSAAAAAAPTAEVPPSEAATAESDSTADAPAAAEAAAPAADAAEAAREDTSAAMTVDQEAAQPAAAEPAPAPAAGDDTKDSTASAAPVADAEAPTEDA